MTARQRLIAQAESQGWTVTAIEWEPVRTGAEKAGPDGGWSMYLERDEGATEEWAGGYNVEQALEWIRNLDQALDDRTNPFACNGKHTWGPGECMAGRGHRGPHNLRSEPVR